MDLKDIALIDIRGRELIHSLFPAAPTLEEFRQLSAHGSSSWCWLPMEHIQYAKAGKFCVSQTRARDTWEIINMRNAFLNGVQPVRMDYKRLIAFHTLTRLGDLLTTDQPNEIFTQWSAFHKAHGDVLVSGLGLGMALHMIADMRPVRSVTVVEMEADVIKLAQPLLRALRRKYSITVIHDDIFEYLNMLSETKQPLYDFAYHDIWYGTGETVWCDRMVPLYRATRKASINHMGGWCERDMQQQMANSLWSMAHVDPDRKWFPYRVFVDGIKKNAGVVLPYKGNDESLLALIKLYLMEVGTPKWEQTFNWDITNEK